MRISILGVRGVPASHGGFETFAEKLSLRLLSDGHDVTVYCQGSETGEVLQDFWNGIRRIALPTRLTGAAETIEFDWKATAHAVKDGPDVALVLGYNTAVFCARLRLHKIPVAINMDGIEWRRGKWGAVAKAWFWANEFIGCALGNSLIADHPEIARHLSRHHVAQGKLVVIPYGGDDLDSHIAGNDVPAGLRAGEFFSVIARPEPENSILQIVSAFSRRHRGARLIVLGAYDPVRTPYHRQVVEAASEEVVFAGAIFDQEVVRAIRCGSIAYVHGHTVGGTNPSLVEALGASSAVIAHDNIYNRWVAGDGARYFSSVDDLDRQFTSLQDDPSLVAKLKCASRHRFLEHFQWEGVLNEYVRVLSQLAN